MNLKNLWWKILCAGILLYALIAGMLVPLKPGITGIDKNILNTGEITDLIVDTYNAVYSDVLPKSYLKFDENHFVEVTQIEILADRKVKLTFDVPNEVPGTDTIGNASLFLTDSINGTLVYPNALILKEKPNNSLSSWKLTEAPKFYKKTGFVFPYRNILIETIRNTFYHIPLWFAMFILFFAGAICNVIYLFNKKIINDHKASSLITAGILMGCLGLITGSLWAKDTWGAYWTSDVKLNMSAISMMIYFAYLILRSSIEDIDKKAKISSAYSIFAFCTIVPLIFVIPRITDSLHPGNGGNPAFGGEDMDNTMRMVFYPAIIGFTLLGVWISQIIFRLKRAKEKINLKLLQ